MKYFRIASDLHLEQRRQQRMDKIVAAMLPVDPRDSESVLLLAGDISSIPDQLISFIQVVEPRFESVVFVAGNHEYYGNKMYDWNAEMLERISKETEHTFYPGSYGLKDWISQGIRAITATLWGDGGGTLETERAVEASLNDFRVIREGAELFSIRSMQHLNRLHKEWVRSCLERSHDGITIVVTHHLPSYQLCHPRFGTAINGGFASNCDDLLYGDTAPALWVHGHTHDTIDRVVGRTRVVCNPAGYHGETNASEYNQYGLKFVSIEELRNNAG